MMMMMMMMIARDRNASDDANDGRQWSAERERVKDENERRAHE